jgi:hypothetical protein
MEPGIEPDFPRHRVMMLDQGPGIVEQDLGRYPAKVQERALHPVEPVRLPLPQRGADMHPPRVTQRRHEQVDLDPLVADPDLRVPKVDLQLVARPRLEAHRRTLLRLQLPPPALDPLLDRPQPDHDPMLARQFLAHDIGIASVPEKALAQPLVQSVENRFAYRLAERRRAAGAKVTPNCVARAAELLR